MAYTIRTTQTESGKGWRHEMLRNGKLTSYAEYSSIKRVPHRMRRWLAKLNRMERDDERLRAGLEDIRDRNHDGTAQDFAARVLKP